MNYDIYKLSISLTCTQIHQQHLTECSSSHVHISSMKLDDAPS